LINISQNAFLKDSILYAVSKLIPGVSGLFAVLLFIRLVGVESYGEYSILMAQCNLFAAFSFGWLNHSCLRYYTVDNQALEINTISKGWIFSTCTVLVLFMILFFSLKMKIEILLLCFICTVSIAAFGFYKTLYQASINPISFLKITTFQSLLAILIPLVLLYYYNSWEFILFGITLSYIIVILFGIINYNKISSQIIFINHSKNKTFKKWISYGVPISLWFAINLAFPYLDRLFIKYFLSNQDLGYYSSLQELLNRSYSLFLFPITMALHPRIMKNWNNNKPLIAIQLIKKGLKFESLLIILILFIAIIFQDKVFYLFQIALPGLSSDFLSLVFPLFLAGFFWQISLITHKMIELKEQSKLMVIFLLVSLIINILGNRIFIPQYGIMATAFTSLVSAAFYFLLTSIYSIRSINIIKHA